MEVNEININIYTEQNKYALEYKTNIIYHTELRYIALI